MWFQPLCGFRYESSWRDQPRIVISEIERIELRPQHVAFEPERIERRGLRLRRARVPLHIVERERRIVWRLRKAALEILHHPVADEVVVLQHAGDSLLVDLRGEQLGE